METQVTSVEVTRLLAELPEGGDAAVAKLVPVVYQELRRLARAQLKKGPTSYTLKTTALAQDAFARLAGENRIKYKSRIHFFSVAARAMRRILADHAIRSQAGKPSVQLLTLNSALDQLALEDAALARLVELRFYAGMTDEEVAAVLKKSVRSVQEEWEAARGWLQERLKTAASLATTAVHGTADEFLRRPAAEAWLSPMLEAGDCLGPYSLMEEIGRGGMGVVWLATDVRLQRRVAIKFHLAPFSGDTLLDEARAVAALHHPGICPVYDVGRRDDGCAWFVMPFFEGETLAQRLRSGPLAADIAVDIARQAAEALRHAHAAGIIHRDIKPSNLMIVPGLGVRVLDFGVARAANQQELTVAAGTPAYMPPEQAAGRAPDQRSDIWSLAVVLHEMLTGKRPGKGVSAPERFSELFSACLRDDPVQRPDAAGFLSLLARSSAVEPQRLNEPATTFHGRERELRELSALVLDKRLVTLTGPGGAGKTRLALRTANQVAESFDGVYMVELGELKETSEFGVAIAEALGIGAEFASAGVEAVAGVFGDKRALLVIDNVEHLLESAHWLASLLDGCKGLHLLVTSRAPLRLMEEREYAVGPLPDEETAVALFVDRARRAHPRFEPKAENMIEIAEICRLLDCLPLAIELTAPRVRLFSTKQLLEKLRQGERSAGSGPRDLPDRQRSLRTTFEWSLALLAREERDLLQRLAVCEGAFSVQLAAVVGGESFSEAGVENLIEHSLLALDERESDTPRLKWLQTIRGYALEQLHASGAEDEARRAHFEWHAELARRCAPLLVGQEQQSAASELSASGADLESALKWAYDSGHFKEGLKLASHLWRFWLRQGALATGLQWLERFLAAGEPDAEALLGVGLIAQNLGQNRKAREALTECLRLRRQEGDPLQVAIALNSLAWVAGELSDLKTARTLSDEALRVAQQTRHVRTIALAWNNSGWIAAYQGFLHLAENCFQKSLALRREAGDRRGEAFQLANAAWVEHLMGKLDKARVSVASALRILEEVRDPVLVSHCLLQQGQIALAARQAAEAVEPLDKAIDLAAQGGNRSIHALALAFRGEAALTLGDTPEARKLLAQSVSVWREIECDWGVALALSLQSDALPQQEASECIKEALEIRLRIEDRLGLVTSFLLEANRLAESDRVSALRLYEVSRNLAFECGCPWPPRRPVVVNSLMPVRGAAG